jgi:pimeloyl-ACP methyl ester carboxylesterase
VQTRSTPHLTLVVIVVHGSVHNESADIAYDQIGDGPVLLMVAGAGGTGDVYRKAALRLSDRYSVITYDRRGNGQSTGDRTRSLDMAQQARDALEVIRAAEVEKAYVFGNSGGANIALNLTEAHPEVVAGLVAHEPPVVSILPDADVWLKFVNEITGTFHSKGPKRAMLRFARSGVGVNPVKLLLAQRGHRPDFSFFLEHEYVPITTYDPDVTSLRRSGVPIVTLAGRGSKDAYYARTAPILAERVGGRFSTITGNHFAFLLNPDIFASELRLALGSF